MLFIIREKAGPECQHMVPLSLGEEAQMLLLLTLVGMRKGGNVSLGVERQGDWSDSNTLPDSESPEGLSLGTPPAVGGDRS